MASNADRVPGRAEGLPYRAQSAGSRAGKQATSAQELPGRAVCAVRRAAAGCPALRRAWAALSHDLLALLTGLRPAIMLDYITHVPEQTLCSLVQEVASLVPRPPGTVGALSHVSTIPAHSRLRVQQWFSLPTLEQETNKADRTTRAQILS